MFHSMFKKMFPLFLAFAVAICGLPVYAYIDSSGTNEIAAPSTNTQGKQETGTETQSSTKPVTPNLSLKATAFKKMSTKTFVKTLGPIVQTDAEQSGVLASVTMAQAILESGWGKSTLAQKANNLFGMKTSLSGNTWKGSTWDQKSKYKKRTAEYSSGGKKYYITASFRKYDSVVQSINDHSAYLTGAKKGSSYRYKGLTGTTSYKKQLSIIRKGGYATSGTYVNDLCKIIKKYKLYKWDE